MSKQKRRSPGYPTLDLERSIDLVAKVEGDYGKASIDRASLAKAMEYSGLSGTSILAISSLGHYGLLEHSGKGEHRVSELAIEIKYSESQDERYQALQKAALHPKVFSQIADKFGVQIQRADAITNYLGRHGFLESSAKAAAKSYLSSVRFARFPADGERFGASTQTRENSPVAEDVSASASANGEDVSMAAPTPTQQYTDWMRLPLGDGLSVKIMTNRQDLTNEQIALLLQFLQLQLRTKTDDTDEQDAA